MKKFACFWALTLLVVSALFASTVHVQWNVSPDDSVTGYKVYSGDASRHYTFSADVGNNTNYLMSLDDSIQVYYFAVTAYNSFEESDYSDEVSYVDPYYTNGTVVVTNPPVNYTYIGAILDYGTNLAFLSHQLIFIDSFTNANFFRLSLVITNKPLIGTVPNDGNSYLYLVGKLDYGTNLSSIQSESALLITRTNAPGNELYRANLVITNKPF